MKKVKAIGYSVVFLFAFFLTEIIISLLGSLILTQTELNITNEYTLDLILAVPTVILLTIFIFRTNKHILTDRGTGIWNGLVISGALTIFIVFKLIVNANILLNSDRALLSKSKIIIFMVCMFVSAGIREEFIFRGVIMNKLLDSFEKKNTKAEMFALVVSSVIFGLVHFSNLIDGASLGGVISQVVSAGGTGFLFGAVYLRCKNIWTPIILHGLWDIFALMFSGVGGYQSFAETVSAGDNLKASIIMFFAQVVFGLFLLRPKKEKTTAQPKMTIQKPTVSKTSTALACIALILLLTLSQAVLALAYKNDKEIIAISIISFSALLIIILISLLLNHKKIISTRQILSTKHTWYSFVTSGAVVLVILLYSYYGIEIGQRFEFKPLPVWIIALNIITAIIAKGFIEEYILHGVVMTSICNHMDTTNKTALILPLTATAAINCACAVASSLFYYNGTDILLNLLFMFSTSLYFGTLYVRSQNIWAVSLLHGALTFSMHSAYALYGINSMPKITKNDSMVIPVFLLASALFLLLRYNITSEK